MYSAELIWLADLKAGDEVWIFDLAFKVVFVENRRYDGEHRTLVKLEGGRGERLYLKGLNPKTDFTKVVKLDG